MAADDPEPALRLLPGEAAADREVLEDVVATEVAVAEQTRRVQECLARAVGCEFRMLY
jgi:hypothetical protein